MQTKHCSIEMSNGFITGLINTKNRKNYIPTGQQAPILTVRSGKKDLKPDAMTSHKSGQFIRLTYKGGIIAEIEIKLKKSHIVFELVNITKIDKVDLVIWGPYPTTIKNIVGETIGVVRDDEFAIGIQALNPKTIGGYPDTDDDTPTAHSALDRSDYKDINVDFQEKQLFRGNTAVFTKYGSRIQSYCRNRFKERIIDNWNHEHFLAPTYDDGGVIGSKIALFACPAEQALDTLGTIEVAEDLPHPTLNGKWAKKANESTASYIIIDFSEKNIAKAIEMTKQAGLKWLYHSAPFKTWGRFELRKDSFPNGWQGFKTCVDQARKKGVNIGFHTLSNFITPNDTYVTPIPDKRLGVVNKSLLIKDISQQTKTILIKSPDGFKKQTTMNTVLVGNELIQFKKVSPAAPWKLLDCQRGAFGTKATFHKAGAPVAKLMDYPYKVFLSNIKLSIEIGQRIAEFCNFTGARQLSFDGIEGNNSTGLGEYAASLFTKAWYDKLNKKLKSNFINDASRPGHYTWHMYTRMNWGEPWYAGFRESQTIYRISNQYYYSRNLMPRMLGWFALNGETSIEDVEWMLARAAGFDAGFAMATSFEFSGDQVVDESKVVKQTKTQNTSEVILGTIRNWEEARMTGAFSQELKKHLQDIGKEFHLEKVKKDCWNLYEVYSYITKAHNRKKSFQIDNPYSAQPLQFIIKNMGDSPVQSLSINGITALEANLKPGEIVKYNGKEIRVYSQDWKLLSKSKSEIKRFEVKPNRQVIKLDWKNTKVKPMLNVELRSLSEAKMIKSEKKARD